MNRLDLTLSGIQNARFLSKYKKLIRESIKRGIFKETEINCILMIHHKFALARTDLKTEYMSKPQFLLICELLFEIHNYQIMERIYVVMDGDLIGIRASEWMKLFHIFFERNLEKQMKYVFSVYDIFDEGYLVREVLQRGVVTYFMSVDDDDGEFKLDMVDLLFQKMDLDHDGIVSFEEYATIVRKQPEMLQFLGKCIPDTHGLDCISYCANIVSEFTNFEPNQIAY